MKSEKYNLVAENPQSTVVEEYTLEKKRASHCQSEAELKKAFIEQLAKTGTATTKVLPPVSRFSPIGERTKKRESVLNKLASFFERFFDISGGKFAE